MSTRRGSNRHSVRRENRNTEERNRRGFYVYGSAAPGVQLQRRLEVSEKQPSIEVQKNRDKARHMSAGYVLFLGVAIVTAAYILTNYLQLQAELTNLTRTVAAKKSELIDLQEFNEEEYNRIVNSIDLEEIKRVAMGVLGMTYAKEGQIVVYEGENYDYMRQVTENSR